jgi:hypothetical protein
MSIDPSNNAKPEIVDELYDQGLIISESGPGGRPPRDREWAQAG